MTDISVIKMIISVAVWRIYPSWVNEKLWAWEGLGHSGMFWARLSRDDFRSKLEIISFRSRVMFISKSFLFPALLKNLAPNVPAPGAFGFDDVLELFLKTSPGHWAFSCGLRLRPRVFFENFYSFFKAEPVLLAWQLWWSPGWAKLFGGGSSNENLIFGRSQDRAQKGRRSSSRLVRVAAVIHGPKETIAWWSQPVITFIVCKTSEETSEFWGACFRDPMFLPFCYSLFSCMWLYSSTLFRMQIRDSEEKQSSVTLPVLITKP